MIAFSVLGHLAEPQHTPSCKGTTKMFLMLHQPVLQNISSYLSMLATFELRPSFLSGCKPASRQRRVKAESCRLASAFCKAPLQDTRPAPVRKEEAASVHKLIAQGDGRGRRDAKSRLGAYEARENKVLATSASPLPGKVLRTAAKAKHIGVFATA